MLIVNQWHCYRPPTKLREGSVSACPCTNLSTKDKPALSLNKGRDCNSCHKKYSENWAPIRSRAQNEFSLNLLAVTPGMEYPSSVFDSNVLEWDYVAIRSQIGTWLLYIYMRTVTAHHFCTKGFLLEEKGRETEFGGEGAAAIPR